ncbi:hypothetical protein BI347_12460 [Chromobacterium sphagni]|uniref:Uncharacterized protein n=1 Tax=Chromobacterium sphagni TaxID=1903179 RepID=A0A1S1X443_9NEIS|nr:hypothetical protein [Chromobacterium sphagni]OHX14224.1 hypothetical protein BI347_12460 [Chromobacterium sphagni]
MDVSIADLDGQILDGLDFCSKSYALFEKLRAEPGGIERFRMRSERGAVKRLLDEIMPICRYVQHYYRAGRYISVRWVDGSQHYDAELHQRGDYVAQGYYEKLAYLEVTSAMHPNQHWVRKMLNRGEVVYAPKGIDASRNTPLKSEPVVFGNHEHVLNFVPIVVESIRKKSAVAYPRHTSLVIQCCLNNIYMVDDWKLLVAEVEKQVASSPFLEILLMDECTQRATALTLTM